ncbi:unnamed protein product [Effrenium voratum]|nr:unnamed protein product [Effrenium voratum]
MTRSKSLFLAQLAETAELFDDMRQHMLAVTQESFSLSETERTMLVVAYNNALHSRRHALRMVPREGSMSDYNREYRAQIEEEQRSIIDEMLGLLNGLIPQAGQAEGIVFYQKIQGDYYRFRCELEDQGGEAKKLAADMAFHCYSQAEVLAEREMPATSPLRLGIALNFADFIADTQGNVQAARRKAQHSFFAALEKLDDLADEEYRDSALMMQLLRDIATRDDFENE